MMSFFMRFYYFVRGCLSKIDMLLLLLLLLGVGLLEAGDNTLGKGFIFLAGGGLIFFAVIPVGLWILQVLENRFPKRDSIPPDTKGLILLGGSFDQKLTRERQDTIYNLNAGRFIQFIELVKKYPHLPCVCTGSPLETKVTQKEFKALGIDCTSFLFESESQHTVDNATKTAKLINPRPDEKWVLVTSAYHMPRAVGLFRKVGFQVIPYPVGYLAPEKFAFSLFLGLRINLEAWHLVVGEWFGLVANYVVRKSDKIFPNI
jgi:uncharacterized SAM-binding protein YcdF (DUF218 family)